MQIPQTVPTGIYSPDDFAIYTDNLDFSILQSNDCEVPLSPQSQLNEQNLLKQQLHQQQQQQQIQSEYIPLTVYQDRLDQQQNYLYGSSNDNQNINTNSMKNDWMKNQQTPTQQNTISSDDLNNNCTQNFLNQLAADFQSYHYPSPLPSPPQENNTHQYTNIFPPSPCSSVEYNIYPIKQEYSSLLPPSPPDSNGAPSPLCEIKSEPDHDNEVCIDIESLLNDSFDIVSPKKSSSDQNILQQQLQEHLNQQIQNQQQPQDHQLLREYLQDTSFQKKHNLKPLALESLFGGWSTRGDIEPVFSLALEQIRRDVQDTCAALDIPPGEIFILFTITYSV